MVHRPQLPVAEFEEPQSNVTIVDPNPKSVDFFEIQMYSTEARRMEIIHGYAGLNNKHYPDTKIFIIIQSDTSTGIKQLRRLRSRYGKRKFLVVYTGDPEDLKDNYILKNCETVFCENSTDEIAKVVGPAIDKELTAIPPPKREGKPNASLSEIADRIDSVADSIAELRINSASDVIHELRNVGNATRNFALKHRDLSDNRIIDARPTIKEVFEILANLYDAIESTKLARLVVSGAVSALVGGSGWPAAICLALTLGSWHGKDAFMAAVSRLPPQSAPRKKIGKDEQSQIDMPS